MGGFIEESSDELYQNIFLVVLDVYKHTWFLLRDE